MSDDSKELSRVEDILSGEDYIPTKPMSRIEKLLLEGGGPGGKLPEVTSDDNGKILKVKDGAWDKGEDISGDKLPQVSSSDNGKVLKVVQGEWNIDKDEGDRLPTVTSADEGKVLKVKNGAWDKDVPEKELPETTSEDSGKALMINDNGDWAKSDIPDPAITAEASGNIASFSDGSNLPMPSLKVGIEAKQDLHGYDSPWVGGAGKNLFDEGSVEVGTAWNGESNANRARIVVPCKPSTTYTLSMHGTNGLDLIVYGYYATTPTLAGNVLFPQTFTTNSVSAYIVIGFNKSNITIGDVEALKLQLEEGSTATDYKPYANICPISGWTACNVVRTGKNLCGNFEQGAISYESGKPYNKCKINNVSRIRTQSLIELDANKTYTISIKSGYKYVVQFFNTQKLNYVIDGISNAWYNTALTFTNVPYVAIAIKKDSEEAIIPSELSDAQCQFEIGNQATPYEPYDSNTYTINFVDGSSPLTVYGGTLDVVSGVLTVDRAYVDIGTLNWSMSSSTAHGFYARPLSNYGFGEDIVILCSHYPFAGTRISGYYEENKLTCYTRNNADMPSEFYILDTAYSDATAFKTAMNGVQLVYELATPITYQLTPTEVKSLLGSNNVLADTGEIESLIYYKQNAEDIADLIETLVPEELPAITSADNDKILTAYGGEWVPKTNPLPDARNYEAGSVLTVRNNHWNPELLPATPGVPRVESDDVGKVLKATGVDTYDWANGTDIIQTTQDSYDAMSDSQKMNGKLYFVHNESDDEEAAIYFMNKCYGKAPSGSKAVYLPLADYEELTTAEKEDPTKIYFVINEGTKVSPTLSADDGNFTVSSAQSGYDPWKVFDGSTRTDNNEYEYCYAPWGEHNGEWIAYSFGTKQIFSKVHIRAAVMRASTLKYYIEGSNDGETWTNLIPDADYVSVYHPALTSDNQYTWVNTDILLDTAKGKFNKIRFRQDLSIGYPYSGNRFNIANWDIYAAAASNKPSIYYKNVLYNPDELPATTISDAGKVLKVNEDGLWDKGDAPIPDINAVQVPPVIFDNGSLKKIADMTGFPGLKRVFLTPTGYEALTQAEKEDLSKIYYVSLYEFFSSNDGTVVIRLNGDKTERLCFFNGFIDNFNSVTPYANFPEELRDVWTTYSNAPGYVASTEYDENGDIRSGRYFGLRSVSDWHVNDMDGDWNNYGPKNRANYAVIDMTSSTALQSNPWADPYDIPNGMTIYYGGKQYSEYEPAKPYVELTQAEYDALPSSKESDGMIHFITDAGKIILNGIQYG